MKALALCFISGLALVYPLVVYLGINRVSPAVLGVILGCMVAIKFYLTPQKDYSQTLVLLLMVTFSLGVAVSNSEMTLRFYPVLMSCAVASMFALSLFQPQSLIERFARMAGKTITSNAKRYSRRLTLLWSILLLVNAIVAGYFALYATMKSWALYNGLLSYVVFILFFCLEYGFRQYYIRRYGE